MKNEADVVAIIARILKNETEVSREVTLDAHLLRDLEMDSLSLTVLAVGLEDEFRIRLTEEDTGGVETVQQLAALVVRRMAEGNAAASGSRGSPDEHSAAAGASRGQMPRAATEPPESPRDTAKSESRLGQPRDDGDSSPEASRRAQS